MDYEKEKGYIKNADIIQNTEKKWFKPWWDKLTGQCSTQLWIPDEKAEKKEITTMNNMWFEIEKSVFFKKEVEYKHSQFSDALSVIVRRSKYKAEPITALVKTKKVRLKPTLKQRKELIYDIDAQRWYYNNFRVFVAIFAYTHPEQFELYLNKKKHLKTKYEISIENAYHYMRVQRNLDGSYEYIIDKTLHFPVYPGGWVHSRVITGAIYQFIANYNAAVSNRGNDFMLPFKQKKMDYQDLYFKDAEYPGYIKSMKNYTCDKERKQIRNDKACIVVYNKIKKQFFMHTTIKEPLKPKVLQAKVNKVIALDPGVRTFQTGYSPDGHIVEFGRDANLRLLPGMKKSDKYKKQYKETKKKKFYIKMMKENIKITNKVKDLHYKTIKYLTDNYKIIIIPEFRVSSLLRSKTTFRNTKRFLVLYSYNKFMMRLTEKLRYFPDIKLYTVTEEYTSKTCGSCGALNDVGGSRVYECSSCGLVCDRDYNGARNIFIKTLCKK